MLESELWLYELIPEKIHSILVSCVHLIHTMHSCVSVYLSAMGGIEESVLVVLNNHVGFQVANLKGHGETMGTENELLEHRCSLVLRHYENACVSHA